MQDKLDNHIEELLPEFQKQMDIARPCVVLDTLTALRRLFRGTPSDIDGQAEFHKEANCNIIVDILIKAVNSSNNKIAIQGLNDIGCFINTLSDCNGKILPQFAKLCEPFYASVNSKLNNGLLPQDIKQKAIIAAAILI